MPGCIATGTARGASAGGAAVRAREARTAAAASSEYIGSSPASASAAVMTECEIDAVTRSKCCTQKWVISRNTRNVPVMRWTNHWNALERAVRPYVAAIGGVG